jgi:PPP family 3-phenylpropionic acid transporter
MSEAGAREAGHERRDADLRVLHALVGVSGSALLPFYVLLLRGRGLEADSIGIVLAVTSLAGVAVTPFWSHAADTRLGTGHTLQLAAGASCLAALGLATTGSSILAIGAAAVFLGAAQGPQMAMSDALTLNQLGPVRFTEYGSFRLWASIGWALGAIAFGALFAAAGLGLVLPFYAAGVALLAIFVARFPRVRPVAEERVSRFGSVGDALRGPGVLPFMAGVLVLSTATHAAWDFVPLRIASGGGGPFLVGLAAGVSAVFEIPLMRSTGSLVGRFGLRAVFAVGSAVYVLASLAWAVVTDPVAVSAVRASIGVGFGLVYVTLVLMTGRLVPDRVRNSGQALLSICTFGLAPVLGGAAGGFVYQHVGPPQLFAASAVGIVLGAVVVWAVTGDVDHRAPAPVSG